MLRAALVAVLVVAAAGAAPAAAFANMNGEYKLSRTPNAPSGPGFPTDWKDYPGGVEYFEVYHGPIQSVYSEVFWTTMSNAIPQEIVDRFDGKTMAIVGLEIDQVRRTKDGDVSVPINCAFNHHHDTAVVGKRAHLEVVPRDPKHPKFAAAGREYVRLDYGNAWVAVDDAPPSVGSSNSAMFSSGNGGEYRKSFHALAPPYAQLVDSPSVFAGAPMQIDTWNRDKMNISGGPFVPGPVPPHSLAPLDGPDAIYSGLLECPLTTRIKKLLAPGSRGFNDTSFTAEVFPAAGQASGCEHAVTTAAECFAAASSIVGLPANTTKATVDDASLPSGCLVEVGGSSGGARLVFNQHAGSKAVCTGTGDIVGSAASLVTLGLNVSAAANLVTITLRGPADVWYGVGFDATEMGDTPYTIVVDGGSGKVSEHKLGNHEAGTVLAPSVEMVSNHVVGGVRTVVVTRPLQGKSSQHYSFSASMLNMNFINAVGSGPTLAYHRNKTVGSIALWPSGGAPACVCEHPAMPFGQGQGQIKYLPSGEVIGFDNVCDRGDLLAQGNPTCDIRTYVGGLNTCHHTWQLLDADQDIPWQDQPLVYYKKFRIYFQEYNASFHKPMFRQDWGIGADRDHAEYDVPQCAKGTPTSECKHTIEGAFVAVPASEEGVHMVAAAFHCHAPTCLRMELWNNDTNELLCAQEPIYGGTGQIDDPRFDEPGYIAQAPCLWGRAEDGLEAPPLVSGMTVRVVAVTNSTYGHHGEMALPEVSLVKL